MGAIPRIAPRIPRNSESCSENGLFTPRAFFFFFFEIGVVPRFLSTEAELLKVPVYKVPVCELSISEVSKRGWREWANKPPKTSQKVLQKCVPLLPRGHRKIFAPRGQPLFKTSDHSRITRQRRERETPCPI